MKPFKPFQRHQNWQNTSTILWCLELRDFLIEIEREDDIYTYYITEYLDCGFIRRGNLEIHHAYTLSDAKTQATKTLWDYISYYAYGFINHIDHGYIFPCSIGEAEFLIRSGRADPVSNRTNLVHLYPIEYAV